MLTIYTLPTFPHIFGKDPAPDRLDQSLFESAAENSVLQRLQELCNELIAH